MFLRFSVLKNKEVPVDTITGVGRNATFQALSGAMVLQGFKKSGESRICSIYYGMILFNVIDKYFFVYRM
jgi:hypothetical protein